MRKLSKNKSLLIKFGKPYDTIILRSYKDKFFYVLAKKYSFGRSLLGMKEAGLISGLSSVSFVLAGPILAGYLGAYVACTSTGCALTMSAVSGGAGGTAAGVAGAGLTNLIYRTKYKNWIKENAGKYIVNKYGKLEKIPLAFITSSQIALPITSRTVYFTTIFTISVFTFVISYKRVKFNLLKNSNGNTIDI
jgi:hypothetical protein